MQIFKRVIELLVFLSPYLTDVAIGTVAAEAAGAKGVVLWFAGREFARSLRSD